MLSWPCLSLARHSSKMQSAKPLFTWPRVSANWKLWICYSDTTTQLRGLTSKTTMVKQQLGLQWAICIFAATNFCSDMAPNPHLQTIIMNVPLMPLCSFLAVKWTIICTGLQWWCSVVLNRFPRMWWKRTFNLKEQKTRLKLLQLQLTDIMLSTLYFLNLMPCRMLTFLHSAQSNEIVIRFPTRKGNDTTKPQPKREEAQSEYYYPSLFLSLQADCLPYQGHVRSATCIKPGSVQNWKQTCSWWFHLCIRLWGVWLLLILYPSRGQTHCRGYETNCLW